MRRLVLVLYILVMVVCTMWGEGVDWKNDPNTDWYTKNQGSTEFSISTAADLAGLAKLVNEGVNGVNGGNPVDFTDKTITLTANITLNDKVLEDGGRLVGSTNALKSWTPIGNNDNPFAGTFDGNNKTVSGVYIESDGFCLGLFGCLYEGGKIENVGVVNSYVKGTGAGDIGGVCGVSSGSISNSYNTGSVTGAGGYVGGVCGASLGGSISTDGKISNSYNTGSVTGAGASAGGVCGSISGGSISNSYNVGSVTGTGDNVGGVCGINSDGKISNSYNAGLVTGTGEGAHVGGVCGSLSLFFQIEDCFYLAGTAKEGVGDEDEDQTGDGTETGVESVTLDNFANKVKSWKTETSSDVWQGDASYKDGRLYLPSFDEDNPVVCYPPVPSIDGGGFYNIYTATQLRWFAKKVNGDVEESDGEGNKDDEINGKLMQDITVSGLELDADGKPINAGDINPQNYWTPIGNNDSPFTGTFDGNGYKVSGVYIDDGSDNANLGLFGYLGEGGEIQNVGVEDSYVRGTGGQASIGGVCGSSEGSILSSYNAGSVEGTQSPAFVGGVCGYNANGGSIFNSYNTGSVTGGDNLSVGGVCGYNSRSSSISNSYNTGLVTGKNNASVGGVCGSSGGSISNSYNIGSVEGTGTAALVGGVCGKNASEFYGKISNCYNVGSVEGRESAQVGGVCGNNGEYGQITDCYYLAGTATSGIGVGTDSGNEKAAPKTAKELAEVMAGKLVGDLWTGFAKYESGTLTLPYFEGCEPPTVILVAVEVANAIDFENEKVKDNTGYEVATDLSFEAQTIVKNEIILDKTYTTIYVRHKDGKEGDKISDVIALSRPAAPTEFSEDEEKTTATSITLKATTDIEGRVIEYGKANANEPPTIAWQSSPTFGDLTPEIEYTFYARIQATESDFASLPIEVNIETKKGYTITINAGITNGTVETDKTIASKDEIVTLTVTPAKDYELASLTVITATATSVSENRYTFEMPGEAVTVTATFKEVKPAPAPDPTPDPEPVYYTVTIPSEITGAIIHGGGTHQVREGSYIEFSIEIDPAGTGEYPTVTVDGYWWNPLSPDWRGNYRLYVYNDCDIHIGEVSGYGTYTLTLPADSLFEGDDLYRSGVGIAVTPASSSPSSDALRYPFGTELTLTAVSDTHRTFVEWMDGSRRSPLTFRLREDTEAYAWFRALHPVGNEEIAAASIRIRTERGGTIVVDTPTRLPIAIYALSGQCLRRSESEGTTRFSGLREGSYLVVVGTHSEVVIVR